MSDLIKRKSYPTSAQKVRLVELLEADPELKFGKFSATFSKKVSAARWRDIAEELNSIPGAKKSWEEWRKTWQDMKAKVKKKQAVVRRSANLTGGGSPAPQLTEDETQILNTISKSALVGHSDSQESKVFFFDDNTVPTVSKARPIIHEIIEIDDLTAPTRRMPSLSPPTHREIEIGDHSAISRPILCLSPHPTPNASEIDHHYTHILTNNETVNNKENINKNQNTARQRLKKSLEVADTLNATLKERNDEMRKQTDALSRQAEALAKLADALSRQADALSTIAKCQAMRSNAYI